MKDTAKKFKFGMEFELFTLDKNGYMSSGGDRLIKRVHDDYPGIGLKKECGKNMIELTSLPHQDVTNIMQTMIGEFESCLYAAEKEDLILYPLGTYPGPFKPEMRQEGGYKVKENVFGKTRFAIAGRCVGLHCHYTLPKGVFDTVTKTLKQLVRSKNQQSMVNTYNLFIASDPALTTFAQSSPFYQGKYLGKDSRVIVYRGGKALKYPLGLYANHQKQGMLQPYKYTGADLLQIIKLRFEEWNESVQQTNNKLWAFLKHGSILDTAWNPVKINSHGTIEQRGMDMNYPNIIIALAIVIKYIAQKVQVDYNNVVVSDFATQEPFKLEGDSIHIPPHSHVLYDLQPKAAYEGLANESVYKYCKGLLKLAKICIPASRAPLVAPLEQMLEEKKTVSDRVLDMAKKEGISPDKGLTESQAAELALDMSKDLFKNIILTKQHLQGLE
ncbi:MAG: glutamate-cysteine ligase family protein [archaeon]